MSLHQILRNCVLSALLATPFFLNAAAAQDNVVARVGDRTITEDDIAYLLRSASHILEGRMHMRVGNQNNIAHWLTFPPI